MAYKNAPPLPDLFSNKYYFICSISYKVNGPCVCFIIGTGSFVVVLLFKVKCLSQLCAVRYYLAGPPHFPCSYSSLMCLKDMDFIYISNVLFIDQGYII